MNDVETHVVYYCFSFTADWVSRFSCELNVFDHQGKKLRREILHLVRDLPSAYDDIAQRIQMLNAAVQYYAEFVAFLLSRWVLHSLFKPSVLPACLRFNGHLLFEPEARPVGWGSVLCVCFIALTLLVWWWERNVAHENHWQERLQLS